MNEEAVGDSVAVFFDHAVRQLDERAGAGGVVARGGGPAAVGVAQRQRLAVADAAGDGSPAAAEREMKAARGAGLEVDREGEIGWFDAVAAAGIVVDVVEVAA